MILALSSPTFAVMFESGMAESQNGRAIISMQAGQRLFGPDALRLALYFIYTGELPLAASAADDEQPVGSSSGESIANGNGSSRVELLLANSQGVARVLELLLVADYMDHSRLKQTAERLIVSWEAMQVENVVNLYEHALGASCIQLAASCEQYMRGMFEVVSATEEWANLDDAHKKKVTTLPQAERGGAAHRGRPSPRS